MKISESGNPVIRDWANDPVHWLAWDRDTLNLSRVSDKPIFLSIHHSGSRWSRNMREIFHDAEVIKTLNEDFIPVQAEQEEMPQLTLAARTLCQLMNNHTGWPLNLFITPEKKPFFAAGYMPLHGTDPRMPGFLDVLRRIKWLWLMKKKELVEASVAFQSQLAEALLPFSGTRPNGLRQTALEQLLDSGDMEEGGFGQKPKFPQVPKLMLLSVLSDDRRACALLDRSLTAMTTGALFDHVDGGFHGYCQDRQWRQPVLGRRLSDQGAMLWAYIEGYRQFNSPLYLQTALRCANFTLSAFKRADGLLDSGEMLLISAENSDDYYLWGHDEIARILGKDGEVFCSAFGVTEEGNYLDPMTGKMTGKNVLAMTDIPALSVKLGIKIGKLLQQLILCCEKLSAVRRRRPAPRLEGRATTAPVAFFAAALARAGRIAQKTELTAFAGTIVNAIVNHLVFGEELCHMTAAEKPQGVPSLDDVAAFVWSLLELYKGTSDESALSLAEKWVHKADTLFGGDGAMRLVPEGTDEILPAWHGGDDTMPSGNSIMAHNLLTLSALTGKGQYRDRADALLSSFGGAMEHYPVACAGLVTAQLRLEGDKKENR